MKIGFLGNAYAPRTIGGAEKVMQYLAEACVALGHQVFVVTLGPQDHDLPDEVNGIRVHRLMTENVYWPFAPEHERTPWKKVQFHLRDQFNPKASAAVEKVMRAEMPDVVATHNLFGFSLAVWPMLRKLGIPVVHTLHDYGLMCIKTSRFRNDRVCAGSCLECRTTSALKRHLSHGVDAVIGVSRHVLQRHVDAGFFAGVDRSVIYPGIPRHEHHPAGFAERARKPGQPFRVGVIGRIEPPKGTEVLLKALSERPDLPLSVTIAGRADPDYLADLKRRYPDPRVTYPGFVDPTAFHAAQDVLVMPSIWEEALGTVIIEAWEHGVPVIGSRIGGIAELIEDGVTGLLFPPGDAGALAQAIEKTMDGETAPAFRDACLAARSRYMPDRAARELCDVLEQTLVRRRSSRFEQCIAP